MKKLLGMATTMFLAGFALPAAAQSRTVSGTVSFQKFAPDTTTFIDTRPARFIDVTLKNGATSIVTVTTNNLGKFSVSVPQAKLPAGSTLKLEFQSKSVTSNVYLDLDMENERKTWAYTFPVIGTSTAVSVSATVPLQHHSQHFNIMEALQLGRDYATARRDKSSEEDIGQVDVEHPEDMDSPGHYDNLFDEIEIAGPTVPQGYGSSDYVYNEKAFADETVLHEYGHHLQATISKANDWASGPDHSADCFVEFDWNSDGYSFGWKEGWPEYYAEAVRTEYSTKLLSDGESFEENPACPHPESEDVVQAILWDVHDGLYQFETHDRIDGTKLYGGDKPATIMFKIFDKEFQEDPALATIFILHKGWVNRKPYPGSHADLDRIFLAHGAFAHPLGDYTVPVISVGNSYIAGDTAVLNFTLNNTGSAYTDEPVKVRAYVTPPSGKVVIDTWDVPAFAGTTHLQKSLVLPATLPAGTYPFSVVVDALDRFPEHDGTTWKEGNNVTTKQMKIVKCGDGVCQSPENCVYCPGDCGACCGNGVCDWIDTCSSCPGDCGACAGCGDGYCEPSEEGNCDEDCPVEGGSCFVAGTPVTMADGGTKPIDQIEPGDLVLSFDEATGTLVPDQVVRRFVHTSTEGLVTVNGSLVTTPAHRFHVGGAWRRADQLDVGDKLLRPVDIDASLTSGEIPLSAVEVLTLVDASAPTFNFEVAKHHNYFAGGVLVHNIKGQ